MTMTNPANLRAAGWALIAAALPVSLAVAVGLILLIEAYWIDDAPAGSLGWVVFLVTASPMMVVGIRLLNRARQIRAAEASPLNAEDTRAPVLYLRAFGDDQKLAKPPELAQINPFVMSTLEENFVEALEGIGPVIAIGRPGEPLPPLGAVREYVDDEAWKLKVSEHMAEARLVVLMLGTGTGLWWEIQQALQRVSPDRLLFYGRAKDFPEFLERAGPWLPRPVKLPGLRLFSLAPREYLLFFDKDGNANFVRPSNSATLWRSNLRKPLLPVYHIALRPLFEQLGVPWSPPPIPWRLLLMITGFLLLLFGSLAWLAINQSQ